MKRQTLSKAQRMLRLSSLGLVSIGVVAMLVYVIMYAMQTTHDSGTFRHFLYFTSICIGLSLLCDSIIAVISDIRRARRTRKHIQRQREQIQIESARRFRDVR